MVDGFQNPPHCLIMAARVQAFHSHAPPFPQNAASHKSLAVGSGAIYPT